MFIANVQNEVSFAESMEKLGSVALSREAETGIGKNKNLNIDKTPSTEHLLI